MKGKFRSWLLLFFLLLYSRSAAADLNCQVLIWDQHLMNHAMQFGAARTWKEYKDGQPTSIHSVQRLWEAKVIEWKAWYQGDQQNPHEIWAIWDVKASDIMQTGPTPWQPGWCRYGRIETSPNKLWRAVVFDTSYTGSVCRGVMWPATSQDLRCQKEREGIVPGQVEVLNGASSLESALKMMRQGSSPRRFNPLDGWVPDGGPRLYIPSNPEDIQTMAQIGVGSLVTVATLGSAAGVFSVVQVIKGAANLRPFVTIPQGQQLVYAAMAGVWVILKPQTGNAAPSGPLPQLFQRQPATGTPFGIPGSQFPLGGQPLRPLPGLGGQAPSQSPFGGQRPATPPLLFRR